MDRCNHIWIYVPLKVDVVNGIRIISGDYWYCSRCGDLK